MKILICGATGFLGRALSLQLQGLGHEVVALVRNRERAKSVLGADIEIAEMNDLNGFPTPALMNIDAVINLAGEPVVGKRWSRRYKVRLWESRVHLTDRLVRWMARSQQRPHTLLSASAIGYYGSASVAPVDESGPRGDDYLAQLCAAWERSANRAESLGLRVVTLRTGIVLGQGGGALGKLVPVFRAGLGGRVGSGEQFVSWIHIRDAI